MYNKTHSTLIASCRAGNVIGGGDWSKERFIPDIITSIFSKKKLVIRSPNAVRPWQHVLEPISGYIALAKKLYEEKKDFSGAWNFAPEDKNFIKVEKIVKKAIKFLKTGSYEIKADKQKHETTILKLDSTKAKEQLHWRPVLKYDENFEWTFNWYKKYYNKEKMEEYTNEQIENYFKKK